MNKNKVKFAASALMSAALLSFTACKSSDEGKGSSEVSRSPGRASEVTTYETTATVTGIDFANRKVTLTTPDGGRQTYTVGPDARNFDQVRVGDKVHTTLTRETALSLNKTDMPATSGEGTVVTRAPEGSSPSGAIATTRQVTGRITAIDGRDVTLKFADGTTRKIRVGKDVHLSNIGPGDSVTARITEATAIRVEKP
jgi:Cu/Ag efflux protein CusF